MCADTYRDTKIIKKQTPEMAKVRKDSQHILSSLTRYIKNSTPPDELCALGSAFRVQAFKRQKPEAAVLADSNTVTGKQPLPTHH